MHVGFVLARDYLDVSKKGPMSRNRWLRLSPELARNLRKAETRAQARHVLMARLNEWEEELLSGSREVSPLEYYASSECVRVLKRIFSARNECRVHFSSVAALHDAALGKTDTKKSAGEGFWLEMIHMFLGAMGRAEIYKGIDAPRFLRMTGREAGRARSNELNRVGEAVREKAGRYTSGLGAPVIRKRKEARARVLKALGGNASDWDDHEWHFRNIIRDADVLGRIVKLTPAEREAIVVARKRRIPFAITPYYAALMDYEPHRRHDHAVRAQVIPTSRYVERMSIGRLEEAEDLDFMGERDTSPVELVTRRYPQIAIFKPFNTCAQICVYCQRNWEIEDAMAPNAFAPEAKIKLAIAWFRKQKSLEEVLITGGDPMMVGDAQLDRILKAFSTMRHIRRVRIGTRAPVVLPMRFTRKLMGILSKYHRDEQRLTLVTHFEHPYEITPDAAAAVGALRRMGIDVYNQQVFTIENSRRFETVALRLTLKRIGVDPYYCFCTKGKEETRHFRVPIARILQERKEEARLTPGTVRMDEPVFNVPRLGKNYLRAGQDHHIIGIDRDGSRIYEFLPWEKNLYPSPTYVYRDMPILEYLNQLEERGEDVSEYRNIWYYF
jgi:lysine 2,3-aminomutase